LSVYCQHCLFSFHTALILNQFFIREMDFLFCFTSQWNLAHTAWTYPIILPASMLRNLTYQRSDLKRGSISLARQIAIRYPKVKLTLTSISWLAVQYKMEILHLAFIFCCIRSWMALHIRIKTYFVNYIRTFTPVNYHLRLQCLYINQLSRISHSIRGFMVIIRVAEVLIINTACSATCLVTNCCHGHYQLGPWSR
jgi:hypothetical protein